MFFANRAFRICFFSSVGTRSTAWQQCREQRPNSEQAVASAEAYKAAPLKFSVSSSSFLALIPVPVTA